MAPLGRWNISWGLGSGLVGNGSLEDGLEENSGSFLGARRDSQT